ncbi:tRNA (N6-isopentenyl adenosine(37)-C2)-methylthiotransferase MiaB [Peptostreptococcus equinus]|uniref:tRNA-2-methylthio-N(6)-dimethylallyladenosine synthase n=1 Tax=Peptostreptococcus equinus TaxID=3003601 RepID=A0ABY7JQX5_9FIRM|nr:tRNA (N6-isopentenyl adenosine(37)-C2)-methylthiotransferase MiaB [Peptostreptococcus sp. CBA3647]WAW15761.1 tRNA (N6-isopentenyl adenosine(37)-C2)-methylthiotransferase MiaB [Peptostreptococcus sp. CBA3647]
MSERKQVEISKDKIMEQEKYIEQIHRMNEDLFNRTGKRKSCICSTFGCQMNEHDSEMLMSMLEAMGYSRALSEDNADIVIYNTCAVRENAELKVYGNLGHLKNIKKQRPDMKIVVCGCMMQQAHVVEEIQKKHRHVDLIFGTHNLYKFPELLLSTFDKDKMLVDVWDVDGEVVEGLRSNRKFEIKSFVNIMYGCNNFCTYCIVPYTRGRERSRRPIEIIDEIKDLVANGVKEVTLLGQNVNSYGKTLDEKDRITFAELLREVNKIEGLERIRFMSSHPKDISDEVIYAIRDCDKVCEFLHLPFQAGSTSLLKKMNRHYTKEDYLRIIEKAKVEVPNIAFSSDIMIGFPGETEADVDDTIDVCEKVRYDSAFTFIYSKRRGTPAAKMENQIPEELKHQRFNRVLEVVNRISGEKNQEFMGKITEVLVEGKSKKNENIMTGKNRQNKTVNFTGGDESLVGKIINVRIDDPKSFSLNGKLVEVIR